MSLWKQRVCVVFLYNTTFEGQILFFFISIHAGRSRSMEDVRRPGTYVPRNQKFNHMLDTAYNEICIKKARAKGNRKSSSGNHLYESFRPVEFLSGSHRTTGGGGGSTSAGSQSASDTEDEEALQRRMTLEKLHAEERGRANKLLLETYDKKQDLDLSDSEVISTLFTITLMIRVVA